MFCEGVLPFEVAAGRPTEFSIEALHTSIGGAPSKNLPLSVVRIYCTVKKNVLPTPEICSVDAHAHEMSTFSLSDRVIMIKSNKKGSYNDMQ